MTRPFLSLVCAALVHGALGTTAQAQPAKLARLQGTVFDSTRALPLATAAVEMIEASDPSKLWRTTTNSRGEFDFDSLPPGTYVVAVTHPRLDSLGVDQLSQGVALASGKRERLRLAVPSTRSLVARICGDSTLAEGSGYVRGTLRHAERSRVAVRGEVQIRWVDLVVTRGSTQRQLSTLRAPADDLGRYTVCGVPSEGMVQMQAWSESDSTGVIDVQIPYDGVLVQDLLVGRSRTVMIAVKDSQVTSADSLSDPVETLVRRGDARLRGSVKRQDGAPLANVRLSVWGTGVEQRSSADGRFTLTGLPTGTYTAEVRALGYAPLRSVVELVPGDGAALDVALDRAMRLDTVRINAQRRPRGLAQFEENRRLRGSGRFITPEMLEKRPPIRVTDLFRTIPGVRVVPGPNGDRVVMRGAVFSPWCTPELWIDGMRAVNDMSLDFLVSAQDVMAVEVYNSGPSAPAQLTGMSGCGAIVLYTGDRKPSSR